MDTQSTQQATRENTREMKGRAIAAQGRIRRLGMRWLVPSQSGGKAYEVDLEAEVATCTCPDYELKGGPCKHIYAVRFMLRGEVRRADAVSPARAPRPTYRQDWPAYNTAQTHEKALFQSLMHDLCQAVTEPPQTMGRPRLPLGEMIFAMAFKVYSTVSTRRFMCDLADAQAKGYLSRVPHFNSIINYLELPEVTPILHTLIERTSLGMVAVETSFAVDSSGFSTSTYTRWFNTKYGHEQEAHDWFKVHLMCGTTTNIVTSVAITRRDVGDTTMFPPLVQTTMRNFPLANADIVADKAYSSRTNLEYVESMGANPYIPFKSNTSAKTHRSSEAWTRLYHFYSLHREEFLAHYHRRSLSESTFNMVKAKFGTAIRSKTETAQINELLCKVLCHNICVVIQSMFELGIVAEFGSAG